MLSIVFIDLLLRMVVQFLCTSLLIKALTKEQFADISFAVMVFSYFAVVLNSMFDSLINKRLSEVRDNVFYNYSLLLKFVGYFSLSFASAWLLEASLNIVITIIFVVALSVFLEHQDLKLRFVADYRPYRFRLLVSCSAAPFKLYFCSVGEVFLYFLFSFIEVFSFCIINGFFVRVKLRIKGVVCFAREEGAGLLKTFISGLSVFTFFRLDQFFVYTYLGRLDYSCYVLAVRFNELVNTSVGIFARFHIPKIFSGNEKYSFVLKRLLVLQLFFSAGAGVGLFVYLKFWAPEYTGSALVYIVLCFGGFSLIFGQLRGVFFVKRNFLMPDAYNALLGGLFFAAWLYFKEQISSLDVAVAYMFGFFVSGVVTTFFYNAGIDFIKNLRSE